MVTHSSVLAWRIPGMAELGGLPPMGLQSQTRQKQLGSSSSKTKSSGTERVYKHSHKTFSKGLLRNSLSYVSFG